MNEKLHLNAKGLVQVSWDKSSGDGAFIDMRISPGTHHADVISALSNMTVALVIEDIVNNQIELEKARAFLNFSDDLEDRILQFVEQRQAQQEADAIFQQVFHTKEDQDE